MCLSQQLSRMLMQIDMDRRILMPQKPLHTLFIPGQLDSFSRWCLTLSSCKWMHFSIRLMLDKSKHNALQKQSEHLHRLREIMAGVLPTLACPSGHQAAVSCPFAATLGCQLYCMPWGYWWTVECPHCLHRGSVQPTSHTLWLMDCRHPTAAHSNDYNQHPK